MPHHFALNTQYKMQIDAQFTIALYFMLFYLPGVSTRKKIFSSRAFQELSNRCAQSKIK